MNIITQSSVITIVCKSRRFYVTIKLGKMDFVVSDSWFCMHLVHNNAEMVKKN